MLFQFLVKLLQRDLEVWWRRYRRREDCPGWPVLYYLLEGESRLLASIRGTVVRLARQCYQMGRF